MKFDRLLTEPMRPIAGAPHGSRPARDRATPGLGRRAEAPCFVTTTVLRARARAPDSGQQSKEMHTDPQPPSVQ